MKRIHNILFALLVLVVISTGCESFLDVESSSVISIDQHQLNSSSDTLYSLIGVFTQLENIAERYVLLGELRGDLMDITSDASLDLKEIYNHNISADNEFNKIEDYYAVITNCNYFIHSVDSSLITSEDEAMTKEYAAIKAIRAWTYLQLALNYGTVKYYVQPILDIKDAEEYKEYSLTELIDVLIQDLSPWKDISKPSDFYLSPSLTTSQFSYFPIGFLLGDLYLWNGEYENAAREYYNLIIDNEYIIEEYVRNTWTVEGGVFIQRDLTDNLWPYLFTNSWEWITLIASSTEDGKGTLLDSITTRSVEITPSDVAYSYWNEQTYYENAINTEKGDLRGDWGAYYNPYTSIHYDNIEIDIDFKTTENVIFKHFLMTRGYAKYIMVYRTGLLYLRYAEAVNRAGKPNLAFAVLKNGLKSDVMELDTVVPPHEKYTGSGNDFVDYVNFEDEIFDECIGIHERGCGNASQSLDYVISDLATLQDSIEWVEDKIIEELALETAFEGNRFHDLMRVALRRNDPSFLADRVAENHPDDEDAIRSKLMDENNWYLE